jgi:hypothetical protein
MTVSLMGSSTRLSRLYGSSTSSTGAGIISTVAAVRSSSRKEQRGEGRGERGDMSLTCRRRYQLSPYPDNLLQQLITRIPITSLKWVVAQPLQLVVVLKKYGRVEGASVSGHGQTAGTADGPLIES